MRAAEAIKRRRLDRAELEKRWQAEAIQRAELERLRQVEDARGRELERQADAWNKANKIRAYIDGAQVAGQVHLQEGLQIESPRDWLDWATRYANAVDPFYPKAQE